MKRKSKAPLTLTKNPEPKKDSQEWIIWAAWADRVTFEEIYKQTGLNEDDVKRHMKKTSNQNLTSTGEIELIPEKPNIGKNSFVREINSH